MSVCCFAGHRDAEETIRPILDESIKWHILTKGVTEFLVGTYGNFDRMASASVLERKKEYPYLRLTLLVAYPPARKRSFLSGYDQVIYPEGLELVPPRFAIPALNRYMLEKSDYLIAFVKRNWGGAAQTLKNARRLERQGIWLLPIWEKNWNAIYPGNGLNDKAYNMQEAARESSGGFLLCRHKGI